MSEIPNLEQMLKLWGKKDLWNRIQEKNRQIADLESKLAESEERYKKAYQEGLLQKQFDKDMEIAELKQQLAEKETRIAELEDELALTEKALELACDYLVSSGDDELFNLVKDIYNDDVYLTTKINYFKTKAKEK